MKPRRRALRTRPVTISKLAGKVSLGAPRRVPCRPARRWKPPPSPPQSSTIAAILGLPARGDRPPRSEVILVGSGQGTPQTLLSVPGHLTGFLWSPDGSRLLVPGASSTSGCSSPPAATAWGKRFGPISAEFAPGASADAEFPRIEGWCCAKTAIRLPGAP